MNADTIIIEDSRLAGNSPKNFKDLTGMKFSRLTVTGRNRNTRGSKWKVYWNCLCECGGLKVVDGSHLKEGATRSCGCLCSELSAGRKLQHGSCRRGRATAEFRTWVSMKRRCLNESDSAYARYGGRGIKVCDRWLESFATFLSDMGNKPSPIHSIERNDNDGTYEPSNCRWATKIEQCNNRSTNRFLEMNGRRKTVAQWSRETGTKQCNIINRLNLGWTPEQAITTR